MAYESHLRFHKINPIEMETALEFEDIEHKTQIMPKGIETIHELRSLRI